MLEQSNFESAFKPVSIRGLTLNNRFIKSATFEGMTPHGKPTDRLIDFHVRMAEGGVGLTTLAYGAVHPDGCTHERQLLVNRDSLTGLTEFCTAIHGAGGRASIQLTHCGYFTRSKPPMAGKPVSPSRSFNAYGVMSGLPFSRSMTKTDLELVKRAYTEAAEISIKAGFDAVEIHMGHGYLLSQFLTPSVNRRTDDYGGSLARRIRYPAEILTSVRRSIGDEVPVFVKINLSDGFRGGLEVDETIEIIKTLEQNGADAFVLSGSYTSRTPFFLMRGDVPMKGMINIEKNALQKMAIAFFGPVIMRPYPFRENYFMELAMRVRKAITSRLVYQGGVVSAQGVKSIIESGFDHIGIGRALIHDPHFLQSIKTHQDHISPCNHCNQCMVEMDRNGVRCTLNNNT